MTAFVSDDSTLPDGKTKIDTAGARWTSCCGIWWSYEAWKAPTPSEIGLHRILTPENDGNCLLCHQSIRRHEPDAVDATKILRVDVLTVDEDALRERLKETQEGQWIRFGPVVLPAKASAKIPVHVIEPVEIGYLALPMDVACKVRVLSVCVGRTTLIDGPIPGECFAVRIPDDSRYPIDRGGILRRHTKTSGAMVSYVQLENATSELIEVLGALFAPTTPNPIQPYVGSVGEDPFQAGGAS